MNKALVPTHTAENAALPVAKPTPASVQRILTQLDKWGVWLEPAPITEKHVVPEHLARRSINTGLALMWIFFGIFGLWAAFAPLNSAVIAQGKVILSNNRKTIQHLEGGIVDSILVREGQLVNKGDIIIKLDETAAKARFELVRKQFVTLQVAEARLIAERDDLKEITFPEELLKQKESDSVVRESLDSQTRLFKTRRDNVEGKISVLNQKIAQFREDIAGLRSQTVSANRQIQLLNQEIGAVRTLVNSGNAPKSRLLGLQRQQADISGTLGEYRSRISRSEQSIAEARIEIINTRNSFLNQVMDELKETQTNLSDTEERVRASEDMFTRINILAPMSGRVTGLKVFTLGGVIKPGETIMEIVPTDDTLVVQARVAPQDIDLVHEGLMATVHLTAYKARFVHPVDAKVVDVSADRFDDPAHNVSYYEARVEVDVSQMAELRKSENVQLYPGMPADVFVVTGTRTLLDYLLDPIYHSFNKSFREE
jgi:HlyD family type I secretion membrane fusion protein